MSVVEFQNIHRAYKKGVPVLEGFNLSLEPGEVVGLLGRNGAGKTTLMRIAMGMLEPQQGGVRVFGIEPRQNPIEVKQRVGYVAEDQVLPEFLRVEDVIGLHRELFPRWDSDLERELRETFDVPLRSKIKELSKGQARQVALLCAIAHRPELLLLDEPAGGLDPAIRREFLETAIQYLTQSGSTILFSSHHMGDVERLADRIVILDRGRVLIDESLDELREGFSLVLLPLDIESRASELLELEECLTIRKRPESFHAVFRADCSRARSLLADRFQIGNAKCRTIPLEEMFIELMGRRK
ncbi:MAG: ABC transporter ATP-binding protein [Acidobacteriota bacterium]|nr:MAG: ABC transporter ATP-binding protein [Acidobacteriota bacterium]